MTKHLTLRSEPPLVTAPHINNAMPSRVPPPAIKNMTGIYLGTDDHRCYPPTRKIVPPLARARFQQKRPRTPTEERRYDMGREADSIDTNALSAFYILPRPPPFVIPNLPPMPPSRYPLLSWQKMVELLRYKEERRGFSGNPVKRRTPSATPVADAHTQSSTPATQLEDEDVAIYDLCKQTQRHFTAANNSGVMRLEYLNPDVDGSVTSHDRDAFSVPLSATVASEVHRLASDKPDAAQGLIDCYKKVCKGNVDVLQHLLPLKSLKEGLGQADNYKYTGFTVKSYRNPNQAELTPNFPHPNEIHRPKTVANPSDSMRPFIPSPYFFKAYSPHQRQMQKANNSPRQAFEDSRIGAVPGAGALSRSIMARHPNHSPNALLNMDTLHGNSSNKLE